MKRSYLFLAEGFEETEALVTVDVMRRAGMAVDTVSITADHKVTGAHGIPVLADKLFAETDFANAEWLVCPGGLPGAVNLHEFEPLSKLLKKHAAAGGLTAAICASPAMVLAPLGILSNRRATCYPGCEKQALDNGAAMEDARVVTDNNIVTANGPSSTLVFALELVNRSKGPHMAEQVASGMLLYPASQKFDF